MELPRIDRQDPRPLVDQLVAFYQAAVAAGRLRPGDRLPTIRKLASDLDLTRGTVQEAWRRLQDEGCFESTVGRGTVVAAQIQSPEASSLAASLSPGALAAYRQLVEHRAPEPEGPLRADLAAMHPDQDLFPVADFGASLSRVLKARGKDLLGYGEPTGDAELRGLLAAMTPGEPDGDPDHVLITNGAQQGLDLVLRACTRPGDGVALAVPSYHHFFGMLEINGLHPVPVRAGAEDFDAEDLRRVLAREDVRLLYVMPTFHNPSGNTLDRAQRQALMEVAAASDVPVLEDEFELELRFAGEPQPTLRSLDPRGLTATVRTFSKGLFPGIRLGWIHADPQLLGPLAAVKRFSDLDTSALLQAATVDFLRQGGLESHRARLCEQVARRHATAQEALATHLPEGFTWTRPEGGYVLWLQAPAGFDLSAWVRAAAEQGVRVSRGDLFFPAGHPATPGLRICLAQADCAAIRLGIEVLGRCARELSQRASGPARRPLIL